MQSVMSQSRMNSGLVPGQAPRAAVAPINGMFVLIFRFVIFFFFVIINQSRP